MDQKRQLSERLSAPSPTISSPNHNVLLLSVDYVGPQLFLFIFVLPISTSCAMSNYAKEACKTIFSIKDMLHPLSSFILQSHWGNQDKILIWQQLSGRSY